MRLVSQGLSGVAARALGIALLVPLSACADPEASESSAASPTAPSSVQSPRFVRAEPGSRPDILIRQIGGSSRRWTGPWPNDLAGVSLTRGDTSFVVELSFSRLALEDAGMTGYGRGDEILVWLDAPGQKGPPGTRMFLEPERGLFVAWGLPPRFLKKSCTSKPELEQGDLTISFRAPRECVDDLDRVRAKAHVYGYRKYDQLPQGRRLWEGNDESGWTAFAGPGESVTISDPASGG